MRTFRETMSRLGVDVVTVNGADVGREGPLVIGFHNYYFTVDGPVSLAIAEALYATPVGRTDIRAAGDCACRPPAAWAKYYDADGHELVSDPDGRQAREWDGFIASGTGLGKVLSKIPRPRFVPYAAEHAARSVVESFHINSELGLYLLLQALRAQASKCQDNGTAEDDIKQRRRGA